MQLTSQGRLATCCWTGALYPNMLKQCTWIATYSSKSCISWNYIWRKAKISPFVGRQTACVRYTRWGFSSGLINWKKKNKIQTQKCLLTSYLGLLFLHSGKWISLYPRFFFHCVVEIACSVKFWDQFWFATGARAAFGSRVYCLITGRLIYVHTKI